MKKKLKKRDDMTTEEIKQLERITLQDLSWLNANDLRRLITKMGDIYRSYTIGEVEKIESRPI